MNIVLNSYRDESAYTRLTRADTPRTPWKDARAKAGLNDCERETPPLSRS
jgi:hypothetical protein